MTDRESQTTVMPFYRRRNALSTGIRTAHARNAADISPAGVARPPVAVTETHLPKENLTVPLISSGWGAAVGESSAASSSRVGV